MKLILHAGMPKAGSSALQERLRRSRKILSQHGILFPARMPNHNFLVAGAMKIDELPRVYRQFYGSDKKALTSDFASFWKEVKDEVGRMQPSTVVMSGETLWALQSLDGEKMRSLLEEITTDIEVVCYVRRPSDFYMSLAQQQMKASHVVSRIQPVNYRPSLEAIGMISSHLHVLPYERAMFPEGDVCLDFAKRFLGGPQLLADVSPAGRNKNESMTAETMAIVQEYRKHVYPDRKNVFTPDVSYLLKRLAETGLGKRPALKPEIRRHIDQSSVDVLWLREKFGITFNGIDYSDISTRRGWAPSVVNDICPVDLADKEQMLNIVMKELLAEHAKKTVNFGMVYKKPLAGRGSPKRRAIRRLLAAT